MAAGEDLKAAYRHDSREDRVAAECRDWVAYARALNVQRFRVYAEARAKAEPDWLAPLKGRDLVCWCKPGEACHADVLLELAARQE